MKVKKNFIALTKNIKDAHYFVMLSLQDDGCLMSRFSYMPGKGTLSESNSVLLRNVNEKNIGTNRILKYILRSVYFPFPYHVILVLPHQLCQTRYDAVHVRREKPSQPVQPQEINTFFTHAVWKIVEKNKKLFMAQRKYDDVNVLLAQNALVDFMVGGTDALNDTEEALAERGGPSLRAGIVQTHVHRPVFAEFLKVLPKRAKLLAVYEGGFVLARALARPAENAKKAERKASLVCLVEPTKTNVFKVSDDQVYHAGSFAFGTLSPYETCNEVLGIGMEAYRALLLRFASGELSPAAKKHIEKILHDELARLQLGIHSFKKELQAGDAYVDAGVLNFILASQKKFPARLLNPSHLAFSGAVHAKPEGSNLRFLATADGSLALLHESFPRQQIKKLFRWLMPHVIE